MKRPQPNRLWVDDIIGIEPALHCGASSDRD